MGKKRINLTQTDEKKMTHGTLMHDTDASFLQFAFQKILNFVHFLLLLVQEVQDDAHGGLLQPDTLDLVLQPVFDVAQSQGGVNQNYCRGKQHHDYTNNPV